ncbi:MAG: hypothetical protein ACP5P4_05210 [Steroidobacteraceae bacterium]
MSTVTLNISGGGKLAGKLSEYSRKLETARLVRVGFLENARYSAADDQIRADRLLKRSRTAAADGHPEWSAILNVWGMWGKEHSRTLSVAQVAYWAEFGTSTQKPRPFMRRAVSTHKTQWVTALVKHLKESSFDARYSLKKVGTEVADDFVEAIQTWPADNKPLTTYIKGFNAGLRDRGTLAKHVDFEVS